MKNFIVLLFLFSIGAICNGQELHLYEGPVEVAFSLEDKDYLVKTGASKVNELKNGVYLNEDYHVVYRDTIVIDTIDFFIIKTFYEPNSDSLFFLDSDFKVLYFDTRLEKLKYSGVEIPTRNIVGLLNNQFLIYEEKTNLKRQVYFLNTEVTFSTIHHFTGEKTKVYSFDDLFDMYDVVVKTEYYPYSKKVRVFTGRDPGQGAGYGLPYKVFTVDLMNSKSDITEFINSFENENIHRNKGYYIGDSYFFDITHNYKFLKYFKEDHSTPDDIERYYEIIDNEFNNIQSPFLLKSHDTKGVVYKAGTLDAYWLSSSLDTKIAPWSNKYKNVVITYAPDIQIEAALYHVTHNILLDKESLKSMRPENLLVLKNMVYAKHNYAFDTPYYQAFFNLFEFYNDEQKRDRRTKNINDLLTQTDLQNLEVINDALKKYD